MAGPAFIPANAVIQGMIKIMRKEGLDKATRHQPIPIEDIRRIYASGAFDINTPSTLQLKTYFEVSLHFGRRGKEGLRELRSDMIVFREDAQGIEYATLGCVAHEKNHQGATGHQDNEHVQRMYSTGKKSCPVESLKSYLGHLNPDCSAFFQRPKTSGYVGKVVWYTDRPVGSNTISGFMSKISAAANLKTRYTNHCVRATTVTMLRDAGVAPNDIAAVTGHKSLTSIDHYSRVGDKKRSAMSHQLAQFCTPSKEPIKRPLFTEKIAQSKKVVTTPDKKGDLKVTEETLVTTHTLEKASSYQEAKDMAKSVLAGAVFNAPTTINFHFG